MNWTTIITSVLAVIFGGGWLATWRVQRREDKKASNEEWHKLQCENKAVGEKKVDLLSGWVEDVREGVLWKAPEDKE